MALNLTQQGYSELLKEIANKEEELRELGIFKGKEAVEHGDVWHDNNSFEQTEIKERALIHTISELKKRLKDVNIISNTLPVDATSVNIGSTVKVRLFFSEDDFEEIIVTVTGNYNNPKDSSSISVNSPLGGCIIGKPVGFSGFYSVNSEKIKVEILEIN